ncbi:MAG: S-adenosylmethionine:tRNA ribosyltransferase-isomerase [Comamonadaceae bacterium]|nr:S-adenosylmethionine:tRNA ribosyltransferase-isomerase [Comamonadaceae bacterium]
MFNDTRVIKARLLGRKPSGGRVEVLIERVARRRARRWRCCAPATRRSRARGSCSATARVAARRCVGRHDDFFELRFRPATCCRLLERHRPACRCRPTSTRGRRRRRRERYQTVYARAARARWPRPTAGLHFDDALLAALRARGVELRVRHAARRRRHLPAGARRATSREHRMHAERYEIPPATADARRRGARARAAAWSRWARPACARSSRRRSDGRLRAGAGETRLFITPGYRFRVVDRADHQLPPAEVDAADAGLAPSPARERDPRRLRARGRAALPLLQLRRRHAARSDAPMSAA